MCAERVNRFGGAHVNRAGHLRKDPRWLSEAIDGDSLWLPICEDHTLVSDERRCKPVLLARKQADALGREDAAAVFLGLHKEQPCFAFDAPTEHRPSLEGLGTLEGLRNHAMRLCASDAALVAYGRAMVLWHRAHRHCGRCGSPTRSSEGGHRLECTAGQCEAHHFPRMDPAIIVLVSRGDECLLGRQKNWPDGLYSTIAGFVEPGESLEDAVRREVEEETNVQVGAVEYHSSQPWPFPSSVMLGFCAEATSTNIVLNDEELSDARWFNREQLAQRVTASARVLPMQMSISSQLIAHWYDGDAPGTLFNMVAESLARERQAQG